MTDQIKPYQKVYPDTSQGAWDYLQDECDPKPVILPQTRIYPDPEVEGVWALQDIMFGKEQTDVIVYLGGYKNPFGQRRIMSDFECCEIIDPAFNIARLIEWGYETGGDFDEACRCLFENADIRTPSDPDIKKQFEKEFKRWGEPDW